MLKVLHFMTRRSREYLIRKQFFDVSFTLSEGATGDERRQVSQCQISVVL